MKVFEKQIKQLIDQYSTEQTFDLEIHIPNQFQAKKTTEFKSSTHEPVYFGTGIDMDEIDQKTEYRRRRSVHQLD